PPIPARGAPRYRPGGAAAALSRPRRPPSRDHTPHAPLRPRGARPLGRVSPRAAARGGQAARRAPASRDAPGRAWHAVSPRRRARRAARRLLGGQPAQLVLRRQRPARRAGLSPLRLVDGPHPALPGPPDGRRVLARGLGLLARGLPASGAALGRG